MLTFLYNFRVRLPVQVMLSPVIVLIPGHVVAETVLEVHWGRFDVSLKRHRWSAQVFISHASASCEKDRITVMCFVMAIRQIHFDITFAC